MSAKFAVLGHTVDAPSLGEVRGLEGTPALVVVSATGVIEQVTRTGAVEAADKLEAQGIDVKRLGPREYLVPGFVDCHIHTSQWAYMGTGIDKPLMADDGFLAKYAFPAESSLNDETARAVYGAALDDMLRNGTTTGLIFGSARADASRHLVSLAIERRGPRSLVGKVGMDRYCPEGYVETTAQSLADMEEFIVHTKAANAQAQGEAAAGAPPLVTAVVTPRFLPTCTPELLRGLGALAAKHDVSIQSHMSETCDELAFSSSLFPDFDTDAAAFAEFGLLRAPSTMAHCVHLLEGEAEILMQHGASIAHCPLSNFFFAKEALPVRQLLQAGVKVGLATDVAGGYSPSMLSAMRHAVLASKTLQFRRAKSVGRAKLSCCMYVPPGAAAAKPFSGITTAALAASADASVDDEAKLRALHDITHLDALHLATQAGADALGLGDRLGSFDAGKHFDAIVLAAVAPNIRPFVAPAGVAEDANDVLHKLLTLGDDRNVRAVWVGGEPIIADGQFVRARE